MPVLNVLLDASGILSPSPLRLSREGNGLLGFDLPQQVF